MLALTLILGVACVVLLVLLSSQYNKNAKLSAENGLMKGRMEGLQERKDAEAAASSEETLTVDKILEAVRFAGMVPEQHEEWIRFMVQGTPFYIETGRLPQIFVLRFCHVDPKEWEMDLFRHAAHLMSDELIMVKAVFDDELEQDGTLGLRFFVSVRDRNYSSFRENLMSYIEIIEGGEKRMDEIYGELVKEKQDKAVTANPFMSVNQPENKILS